MSGEREGITELRVLVLPATRRDGEVSASLLARQRIECRICPDILALVAEADRGVGALLFTDAAFLDPRIGLLLTALRGQPAWSDTPVILLQRPQPRPARMDEALASLTNVTVLERPSTSRTLVSSVQAALRARVRQYQLRDQVEESRRTAEQLRTTERALRRADQRKDMFLATLAHELRNPLAPIRNAAAILRSRPLPGERLDWIQSVIQRQATHMALLLDDLLDVARITQGKIELKKRAVTLTEIVDSAVETARPLLDGKQHQLRILLPQQSVTLYADPLRVAQALSNLLTNAAKYTDAGGAIRLVAEVEASELRLSVLDNGIGISAEALPELFTRFYQVQGSAGRSEGGLGIGLSLVKGLIQLHGGSVQVHSEGPGCGSLFSIRLPLLATPSAAATADRARSVDNWVVDDL